jgi:dedicated sortase system histidine kinase
VVTGIGGFRLRRPGRKAQTVSTPPPKLDESTLSTNLKLKQRPGLKIRTKLLLLILSLLAIPYMGYNSVRTMEKFLLEGQMEALKLTSEGIAVLLEDRDNLFSDQAGAPEFLLPFEQLPKELDIAIPFEESLLEWSETLKNLVDYTGGRFFECDLSYQPNSFSVSYGSGLHESYFYFLFYVTDDIIVLRDPERLSLDHSDQLRLVVELQDGTKVRYLFTAAEPGRMSIYEMKQDWRYTTTGDPIREIVAEIVTTERGYGIKARASLFSIDQARRITFDVIDVDDAASRTIERTISTSPDPSEYALGRVRLISPGLARLIEPLYLSASQITIWDRDFQLRAETGTIVPDDYQTYLGFDNETVGWEGFSSTLQRIADRILRSPLIDPDEYPEESSREDQRLLKNIFETGTPIAERRRYGNARIIAAGHPVWLEDEVIGSILIKQSGNKILSLQSNTLRRFTLLFLGVFLFLTLTILFFAFRLTYRVTHLQKETEHAATPEGRLRKTYIQSGARSADEIGDLSRAISQMLQNLSQYTQYLERLPNTLAHEMHNPLNVVNSSLQNLERNNQELFNNEYLNRARNGILRLQNILTSLTEAASLKDGLESEIDQREHFNLVSLVTGCVQGYQSSHPTYRIIPETPIHAVSINGSPDHIAQMLDKLVDNAVAFGNNGGDIVVRVKRDTQNAQICVLNWGSVLPSDIANRLFEPMVSSTKDARRSHLGLGLYIARIIAEFHGGKVTATNFESKDGVKVTVTLPLSPHS